MTSNVAPIRQFKKPNTTLFPNYYFDELPGVLNGNEFKLIFFLYRWTANGGTVTLKQIMDGTGISSKQTARKAIAKLESIGEAASDRAGDKYWTPMEDNASS